MCVSVPTTEYINNSFTHHLVGQETLRCGISAMAPVAHSGVALWDLRAAAGEELLLG
jgi:hypothetical protein